MGNRGERSPSEARSISPSVREAVRSAASEPLSEAEREQLRDIALALPAAWVVSLEPPFGQVAISPTRERPRYHRCWVGSVALGRLYRDVSR